jgi:hypothetical protein
MRNLPQCISPLVNAGINLTDALQLRKISITLHTWHEHECNGTIQRDGANGDGKPFWYSDITHKRIGRTADRERGALKRLDKIMSNYPDLTAYVQGDPRGASLYILRAKDVPEGGDIAAYYSRGLAVYR